jgi:sialic acid synthase SpsE
MPHSIFENLFVLELASNHWGDLKRGLKIIDDYSKVARVNGVRAAIKLQFRDVDNFIHQRFRSRTDIRYIKKTLDTQMSWENYAEMVAAIRDGGMITMATPFDEFSVDKSVQLGIDILKLASSDIKDWVLIEKIAKAGKPVIASSGGSSLKDLDDLVEFFNRLGIPFALNHCVSLYPSEDSELELNQVDFLRDRYPENVIGFSTHEYHDWQSSLFIAYSKGARIFERHIDIDYQNIPVSSYCSLPHQIDEWFKAFKKAQEMCGGSGKTKRIPSQREINYLDSLVRGVYARKDLPSGHRLTNDDIYLAIPLQRGQISSRELIYGELLLNPIKANEPIHLSELDGPYKGDSKFLEAVNNRGIED